METAMMLLPVHRTTHLTFSKGVCHFSQWALKYLFGKFERLSSWIASSSNSLYKNTSNVFSSCRTSKARKEETELALGATGG